MIIRKGRRAQCAAVVMFLALAVCTSCLPATGEPEPGAGPGGAEGGSGANQEVRLPESIVIGTTLPVERPVDVEVVSLPNCGGTGTLTQSLGTQTSVLRGVTLGAVARLGGGAEVAIPETARIYLQAEIEGHYEDEYQRANARLDSISMTAAPNTHVAYEIVWEEQSYTSLVNYTLAGVFQEADYTFILQVPKVIDSREVMCPDKAPESAAPAETKPETQPGSVPEVAQPETAPSEPAAPQSSTGTVNTGVLDSLLGSGNWHCIDGFPNGVTIDRVPRGLTVASPMIRVDKLGDFYFPGNSVPEGGLATVWFQANISGMDCTTTQAVVTRSDIDGLLGQGNWYCLPDYPTGVKAINVPNGFVVKQPMTSVDKLDVRYYKGDVVPAGGEATVWFSNNVYPNECP